ncbi:plakophilin-2 isoform X2 [Cololabis saira]|uniref:plakophilin-2 isoform X2 n=1 Tax=Cololabis saira TaxID=129043 RepID=UPI002AD37412|nr:plakophilin-2 isoform X2 [Cololabis saira]
MEEAFFPSPVAAYDVPDPDDTSLALPAQRSSRLDSIDRSVRVQQQVLLTLKRKTRKSFSNGGVHLHNTSRSFDAADGTLKNTKINGFGFSNSSENHVQRPSRKMELAPPPSPKLSHSHFNYSTYTPATRMVPGPVHSHMGGATQDISSGSDPFRRYARSESTYGMRRYASTTTPRNFRWRSIRETAGPQYTLTDARTQQHLELGSPRCHQRENLTPGDSFMRFGSAQPDGGLTWLAGVRKGSQEYPGHMSYTSSVGSAGVDTERLAEAALPMQQIRTQRALSLKSDRKPPEMTLERAVTLLTQDNEEMLIRAATCIQSQCFQRADAKKRVFYLHGVKKLLQLLDNDSEEVQRVAATALRNVVYQSNENKEEVKDGDGLAVILKALTNSHDMDTRRQLTGLLWNLSSHDILKEHFPKDAARILTKSVLVPGSGINEGENPKDELFADDEAFYSATSCLRNLSCAGPDVREEIRNCENLIDSLIYYTRGTVANRKTDDKSTENCVCILHNVTYRIELPGYYTHAPRESQQNLAHKQPSLGCFSSRSAKINKDLKQQQLLLEEMADPRGKEWLWSPITFRMYLSLVACSTRDVTRTAAVGALLNITGGNGEMTNPIAFTIVQRENGLQHIKKVLVEEDSQVKRTAILLVKNLSRYQELHPAIVEHVLPEVVKTLPDDVDDDDDNRPNQPNEVTASLCNILINLSQSDVKNAKVIIEQGAIPRIINISYTYDGSVPNKAGRAACVLLSTIWKYTDLHGDLKKRNFKKSDFINARTEKLKSAGDPKTSL